MQYFIGIIWGLSLYSLLQAQPAQDETGAGCAYSIKWIQSSLTCIAEEGGYGRIRKLRGGALLAAYEDRKGNVYCKTSADNGGTWSAPILIHAQFSVTDKKNQSSCEVNIANPELVELHNGEILFACNLRPRKEKVYPYSIAISRSKNGGKSWSRLKIIYQAALLFRDGCWEPSFLLLPDSTLHLYFANENPYRKTNEQEISVMTSSDDGITWSNSKTVSFRKGFRDGMPVAALDNGNILVAIEDNADGQFKPFIVFSPVSNAWDNPVPAVSQNRYGALANPLPKEVYAGAPYLIRTDMGLFVLSYQTTQGRTTEWEHSTMEVVVSDSGRNFTNPTRPFEVPLAKEAKWNSLTDLGNDTIAAVATTNFDSDKIGIWMMKGKLIKTKNHAQSQ